MSSCRLPLDSSYRKLVEQRRLRDTARTNTQRVGDVCLHPLENKSLNGKQNNKKKKKKKKKQTSAVNNSVKKIILDKGSCEKLDKKFKFGLHLTRFS